MTGELGENGLCVLVCAWILLLCRSVYVCNMAICFGYGKYLE